MSSCLAQASTHFNTCSILPTAINVFSGFTFHADGQTYEKDMGTTRPHINCFMVKIIDTRYRILIASIASKRKGYKVNTTVKHGLIKIN